MSLPPKLFFASERHYAAYLALMDGTDRYDAALVCPDVHGRAFFLRHAAQSLRNAQEYLRDAPPVRTRPEYSAGAIRYRAATLEIECAMALQATREPPFGAERDFFLFVAAPDSEVQHV